MLAYKIKGRTVLVERCGAALYVVRNIPLVFENRIAIGASQHKTLVQKFLDSYAGKVAESKFDVLDVDFSKPLEVSEANCNGCVYWNGKGCEVNAKR